MPFTLVSISPIGLSGRQSSGGMGEEVVETVSLTAVHWMNTRNMWLIVYTHIQPLSPCCFHHY